MIYTESLPIAPVTVEEVKAHLRIDDDIEDALLEQYILSATQEAEQILEREIIFRKDPKALSKDIDNVPPTVKQYIYCSFRSCIKICDNLTVILLVDLFEYY